MPSPYDPAAYAHRFNMPRPKNRYSAEERRKKQKDADFWSSVGAALPGIGGIAGGIIGGAVGGIPGAGLGASLGGAAGQGLGSFATNHAQGGQEELDEASQERDLLMAMLAQYYGSAGL